MCIYIYIYTYVYTHIFVYIYIYIYIYIQNNNSDGIYDNITIGPQHEAPLRRLPLRPAEEAEPVHGVRGAGHMSI